jgi:hypothetical protein
MIIRFFLQSAKVSKGIESEIGMPSKLKTCMVSDFSEANT